jgi:hypothetical protein
MVLALLPQAAQAAETALEPADKWVLSYAEDSCRLARAFGKDADRVILVLDQFQPGGEMDLSLVGKRFGRSPLSRMGLTVAFGPDLPKGELHDALLGTLGPDKTTIIMAGPRDLLNRKSKRTSEDHSEAGGTTTPEQEAAITEVRFTTISMRLALKTGSMKSPLGAMRTCMSDIVKTWGLDPVQQAALSARVAATTKPGLWLKPEDYPSGPLFMGASAIVRFRMMVGADGVPTQCFIQQATNSPEFIKLTCDLLMKRARFSPALDREGKPIASYYTNSVRWLAP